MEAAAGGAEPAGGCAGAPEEPVVSLADVLAENEELEKEARAVLGGSDHERCSYSQVRGRGRGRAGEQEARAGRQRRGGSLLQAEKKRRGTGSGLRQLYGERLPGAGQVWGDGGAREQAGCVW